MKTITTKRISPTIPVALEPEIKAYIAKRVAEFKAKAKEAANG